MRISRKTQHARRRAKIDSGDVELDDRHRRAVVAIASTRWASVTTVVEALDCSREQAWFVIRGLKALGIVRKVPRDVNVLMLEPDIAIIDGDICRAVPLNRMETTS